MKRYIIPSLVIHRMELKESILEGSLQKQTGDFDYTEAEEDTDGTVTAWSKKYNLWDIEDE